MIGVGCRQLVSSTNGRRRIFSNSFEHQRSPRRHTCGTSSLSTHLPYPLQSIIKTLFDHGRCTLISLSGLTKLSKNTVKSSLELLIQLDFVSFSESEQNETHSIFYEYSGSSLEWESVLACVEKVCGSEVNNINEWLNKSAVKLLLVSWRVVKLASQI